MRYASMRRPLWLLLGVVCATCLPDFLSGEERAPEAPNVAHADRDRNAPKPRWLMRFEGLLEAETTEVNYKGIPKQVPLKDLVYLLGLVTKTNVVLDPVAANGERRIDTAFTDAKVARAVQRMLRSAELQCVPLDGAIFVTNEKRVERGPSVRVQELPKKLRNAFSKNISFDFVETPLVDALAWLSKQVGVEFRTGPNIDATRTVLSLRLLNIPIHQALAWIMRIKGYSYRVTGDEAIRLVSRERK